MLARGNISIAGLAKWYMLLLEESRSKELRHRRRPFGYPRGAKGERLLWLDSSLTRSIANLADSTLACTSI